MSALPRTLKNFNVFVDSVNWVGVAATMTLPKLTKKTDSHRGAGMIGEVDLALGWEKLQSEVTYTGFDTKIYRQLGRVGISDLPLRYVAIYEDQDTCATQGVEIYMRGFARELDPGDTTPGEKGETKMTYSLTYYRLEKDGIVEVELDFVNGIERFGDSDLAQQIKDFLGL
ncbi:phage major tail tube protein [Acinetobacter dispersus]|uniref:phage major tail tube protein n=1 Tax=Acinetobacter dispersus TaxID=70348 RepID=UPI00132EEAAD|nr:phage major tail tube protein [Acinetobacter dispersus]QHH99230.1 phage major tail tube protein [Acinetobacter dispersus]